MKKGQDEPKSIDLDTLHPRDSLKILQEWVQSEHDRQQDALERESERRIRELKEERETRKTTAALLGLAVVLATCLFVLIARPESPGVDRVVMSLLGAFLTAAGVRVLPVGRKLEHPG